jgi:hypothetical protein
VGGDFSSSYWIASWLVDAHGGRPPSPDGARESQELLAERLLFGWVCLWPILAAAPWLLLACFLFLLTRSLTWVSKGKEGYP